MENEVFVPEKIVPGGQALGTLKNGKKIFIWGALPGEEVVEYKKHKEKTHYIEAIATKILKPSLHRVLPKDEIFLSTSPWQIMSYDYELKLKSELVVEMFREHKINILPTKVETDRNDYFYRNKMEYALYWNNEKNKIELAFHERGSHRKIPVKTSSIERPEILKRAKEIIDELNSKGEEARKYQSLLFRCNLNGDISGGLYENNQPHPKFKNITDTILGQQYYYSPNGFFQINLPVYEMALKEIKTQISTEKVLDLYAGVGTIGLSVARNKKLTLVETDKHAFSELEKNCGAIALPIFARAEEALDYIESDQTVILDPPRAGCDKRLIERLLEIRPKMIIYLSCNPATQARDIKLLLEKYEIKTSKTFNFFPRTPHIENLVTLC